MFKLSNLPIGTRLALGFSILIGAAVTIAVVARIGLAEVQRDFKLLTEDRLVKVERIEHVKENVGHIATSVRNIVLLDDEAATRAEADAIRQAREHNGSALAALDKSITSDKGRALLEAVNATRAPYNDAVQQVSELGLQGQDAAAIDLMVKTLKPAQERYFVALDKLIDYQRELMKASAVETATTVSQVGLLLLLVAGGSALVGAALAWAITRSITQPMAQAVAIARTVAAGDLRSHIEVTRADEAGQLLAALKDMNDALLRTVTQVRGNAESVATASSEIAQGNTDLSQRTEEQASNLQQTAASMEQLTATVKQNAETARQAEQLASHASRSAAEGGQVVGRVVATMNDISESSRRIGDIIGTIDGIAFQTNILALNAAVEAARAGDQGRGFAVVAGEVRTLAQRSAEAAREIKSLIGASVERVEAGSALVNDAGRTMQDIVGQVKRVSDLIGEISAASVEQTQGIGQVGDAVTQLDQVTQQNAALVEESAAAAESLRLQAVQLNDAVSIFQVPGSAAAVPASAAAPRTPARDTRVPASRAPAASTAPGPALATPDGQWAAF